MSRYPAPVPGLVIRYAYLWREEHARGQEEGAKDRPCAIVLAVANQQGEAAVTVLPITHSPPRDAELAVEIPPATKARLGLDGERSWIVVSEANRFVWPGPDLRPLKPGDASSVAYGALPYALFRVVKEKMVAAIRSHRASVTPRND